MDVIMPQLGETVAEGKIGTWFKSVGDPVKAGDNLFEIETDKVSMEVQATESGVLTEIRVGAGETVPVGTIVAVLGAAGEAKPAAKPARKAEAPKPARAAQAAPKAASTPPPVAVSNGAPVALEPFNEVRTPLGSYGKATGSHGLKITPLARRLASQAGIDVDAVARLVRERGGWRIGAADVKNAPAARATLRHDGDVEKLTRIRLQTAQHLAESWRSAPHVFQAVEVDFSGIERARAAAKQSFAERHGITLTYLPFVARAVCLALVEFPRINARFDKDRLLLSKNIHLGIAVDLAHQGLIVPVLRHADEMTVSGLAKAIARLVEKARSGKLVPGDVEGGTYSISNNGSFGTMVTTPIINLPQVAVLSTDAVKKRAVVVETETGDALVIRPVGVIGQSFDHRAMDGAYSASFLKRLQQILETRNWAGDLA